MSKHKMVGPRVLLGVFISLVFASLGLLSCGGNGGSGTTAAKLDCKGASCAPVVPPSTPPLPLAATCTATSGATTLNAGAARAVGVAPLAVFFDATATTTTVTSRPFHDLEVLWDFGDPASGTWNTGSRAGVSSRNSATGPVAAHVFEWSGGSATTVDYVITISVRDGSANPPATCNVQITVQNPDTVFATPNTYCFSNSSDFTGCPADVANAQKITTSDFDAAINNNIGTRKRLLFHRGHTFNSAIAGNLSPAGPGIIGAFDFGVLPIITTTNTGIGTNILNLQSGTPQDWRIMDLEFDGSGNTSLTGIGVNALAASVKSQLTLLRLNIHDTSIGFAIDGTTAQDQIAVIDSNIHHIVGVNGECIFSRVQNFAYLGNIFTDIATSSTGHNLRIALGIRGVISSNTFSLPASGGHTLKFHSTSTTAGVFVTASELNVISDNKFVGGRGVSWTVALGPQNAGSDERVQNFIVERNWFVADPGTQIALKIMGTDITARNNIFDMSGATAHLEVDIAQRGIEPPPNNVHIFNNTGFSSDVATTFTMVGLLTANSASGAPNSATNTIVENNLGYAPNTTTTTMVNNLASAGLVLSNNSSDSDIKTIDPLFVGGAIPIVPANFKLGIASPYIDGGLEIPVFSDFFGSTRPQNTKWDIGAAEF